MTASSGIIHQEMPQKYNGLMQGFQLWLNLPAKKKMIGSKNRGIERYQIPVVKKNGTNIKPIAGKIGEAEGPVRDLAITIEYFDVELALKTVFEHATPKNCTTFAYVVDGSIDLIGKTITEIDMRF